MERYGDFDSLLLRLQVQILLTKNWAQNNVPVNSKTAHLPPPRVIPGHLTRVKLRTVGNLTLNEARPGGHLTFVPKTSVSGRKQKDFAIL